MKMRENTKSKIQNPKSKIRIVWLVFALAIPALYLFGLTIPLLGPDEPRYSQVAREMFERNDWITPTLGGFDWFEKPALLYWLQIASYKIFGVTEFAARFGSAIFGLGTILSLWILGKFSATENTEKERDIELKEENISKTSVFSVAENSIANWLAVIAASSIGLLAFSRGASFDIILTFPITASLVAFFIWENSSREYSEEEKKENKENLFSKISVFSVALFSFYFFIGVALIAKGLVGIVFPFAIVGFYYVLRRRVPSKSFVISLVWGTLLSLIVASAWYLPMYQANGWKFIDDFFIQHHFQRYSSNKYMHPQPFHFFFWVLPLMTIPWLPFFFAAIWKFFRVQSSESGVRSQESGVGETAKSARRFFPFRLPASPLLLFAFSWMLVPLVFFSFSGSKLPGYILPALPAALIITAEFVRQYVQESEKRRVALLALAFATFVFVAAALQFVVPSFAYRDSVKGLMEAANSKGYTTNKVLNLHNISHNSEFYFAGRLARAEDGKLRKYLGVSEVAEEIKRGGGNPVLVLVTHDYFHELPASDLVNTEVLADNGELIIAAVSAKN